MKPQRIRFFGNACDVACDRRCDKAWGINGRPRRQFSDNEDDHVYLPDDMLGTAPGPGETCTIAEGCDVKPSATSWDGPLNKWCVRECERSVMVDADKPIDLPDMNDPRPNMPSRKFSWRD